MATQTAEIYYLLSGEGESGTWEKIESDDFQARLIDERCNGDRFAMAIEVIRFNISPKAEA